MKIMLDMIKSTSKSTNNEKDYLENMQMFLHAEVNVLSMGTSCHTNSMLLMFLSSQVTVIII